MKKLDRDQLIALVALLLNAPPEATEGEIQNRVNQVEISVPDPNVSGSIFWDYSGETPEEIIDKALAYKAIAL